MCIFKWSNLKQNLQIEKNLYETFPMCEQSLKKSKRKLTWAAEILG